MRLSFGPRLEEKIECETHELEGNWDPKPVLHRFSWPKKQGGQFLEPERSVGT